MLAPAGLGRLGEPQVQVVLGIPGDDGSAAAAATMPVGKGFTGGAAAGWNGTEGTGLFQLSSCYVITGDPIGFMEGLYGPSITAGATISAGYTHSTESSDVSIDCGAQISLFPSFALGVNCSDLAGEATIRTGFSHVFNRSLRVHASFGDQKWQGGGELTVKPVFKILAGTDGSSFNGGLVYTFGRWTASYGARFMETSMEHCIGITGRFP